MAVKTPREKELEALQEANTLKNKFDLEAHNQLVHQERKKRLEAYEIKSALHKQKRVAGLQATKQKTAEYTQQVEESRKQASRYPLQQHNVASLIMEMEPRFAALIRLLGSIKTQLIQEYITDRFSEQFWQMGEPTSIPKIPKDKKMDIPDLKYFVKVNDNGTLEANYVPACLSNFLVAYDEKGHAMKDKDGHYLLDKEKAPIFQLCFQKGVEEWLDQKEYFVFKEGNDFRIYPQSLGKKINGTWTFDPQKVEENYDLDDCNYNALTNAYTPKPNAVSRRGKPLCLDTAAFESLKNDSSHGPNLSDFLEAHFAGLTHQYQDEELPDNSQQTTFRM